MGSAPERKEGVGWGWVIKYCAQDRFHGNSDIWGKEEGNGGSLAARCLQRAENQQRQDPGGEDTRMAGAQRGRRPRIGTDLGQLGLCSVLCSHHTRTPTSSPQLGKEKGSLGRERELPLNPEFASSVALGKVLSFSVPQFLHLSNGLVIPFLHGRHEGTWQVFQNRVLTPGGILLPCPLHHPERASFALSWSAEDDGVHWPLLSTGHLWRPAGTFPYFPLSPSLLGLPSVSTTCHIHTLKLRGLFNPKCEGRVPHLLPRGHGVMGKPSLHSIPHPWWAVAVLKASATSGPGPPSPHGTRGTGALTSGGNTPSLDPQAHLGSRAGRERLWALPSHQKGTSRVASAGSQGRAEDCLERWRALVRQAAWRTCSCSPEPPASGSWWLHFLSLSEWSWGCHLEGQLPGPQVCKKLGRGSQESADKRDIPSPPGTLPSGVDGHPGPMCVWCLCTRGIDCYKPQIWRALNPTGHFFGVNKGGTFQVGKRVWEAIAGHSPLSSAPSLLDFWWCTRSPGTFLSVFLAQCDFMLLIQGGRKRKPTFHWCLFSVRD